MATFVPRAVDDSGFVIGTDLVSPMGALCDETSPDSVDEGDAGLVRMTADRKLLTRVVGSTDANRLEVDSSGRVTVAAISTSVTPGVGATSLGKAEDAAHTSGDVGVMALGVRNDSDATLANSDLDYSPLATDNAGHILSVGGILEGNAPVSLRGFPALAVRADTATARTTAGNFGYLISDASGRLWTAPLSTGTNSIGKISDITTSIVPGTAATNLGKAEDAAHSSGDTGVAAWGVANEALSTFGADGDYTPHAVDTKGRTLLGAGTLAIGKLASNSGVDIGDVDVTSVIPGVGATNLGKELDDTYDLTGTGVMMLAVRNQLLTPMTSADFDYTPIAVEGHGAVAIAGYDYNDTASLYPINVTSAGNLVIDSIQSAVAIAGSISIQDINSTDTFTGSATGTEGVSYTAKYHSLQVVNAGSVTVWDVRLEGSNDASSWTQIIQHTNVDLTGTTKQGGPSVFTNLRTRCAGYTGSGNLVAYRHSVT